MKYRQKKSAATSILAVSALMAVMATAPNAPAATSNPLHEKKTYKSLAEAATAAFYRIEPEATGATAWNAAHGVQMSFNTEGWQLKSTAPANGWSSSWHLVSFGYGEDQTAAAKGDLRTNDNRLELKRAGQGLTEWLVNQPSGVEHGFTLTTRPRGQTGDAALRLVLKIEGDLTARADEDGQRLTLASKGGEQVLRYEKLKVWDSNGQELVARMQTNGRPGEVWLEVQDASAVYPLTIDPIFVSMTKLTASDNGLGFGGAVAISGDTAIVGASSATVGTNSFQGAAYVFIKTTSGWSEQQKLSAADGAPSDNFGEAVAIDGDTVIVSAISDDLGTGNNQGSAYIFVRNGTSWSQQQKLTASDSEDGDNFGISVAINGNTAVVGVPYDVIGGIITQGSVYVYTRNGTTWSEQQHIIGSQTASQGEFGSSVAIEGNTLIVGAWLDTVDSKIAQGSASIYVRNGTVWSEQQILSADDGAKDDLFGTSVGISGETVIVGASEDDVGLVDAQGSAYIFVRSGTTWTQEAMLTSSDGGVFDKFGFSVSLSGDRAIVGAPEKTIGANSRQGAAYVFVRNGTTWTEDDILTLSTGLAFDRFGFSVSINGDSAIVGSFKGAYIYDAEAFTVMPGLLNISTRMQVLAGDQVLIGGFIITGTDPKMVILRAIGPSLTDFGVDGALADPVLELRALDGSVIATNDNWTTDRAAIEATGLQPSKDLESAIVATLDPGAYTAIVSGVNGTTGVGLVESYDLDAAAASDLANISTRGFVATESNVMIGGFILGSDTNVLIRAIGPSLTDFGVAGALADPTLELRDVQGTLISSNDNWKEPNETEIAATGLQPGMEEESAILETLPAGAYTAIVAGAGATTGVGLVEVYRLP